MPRTVGEVSSRYPSIRPSALSAARSELVSGNGFTAVPERPAAQRRVRSAVGVGRDQPREAGSRAIGARSHPSGRGWILVARTALAGDDVLGAWIDEGRATRRFCRPGSGRCHADVPAARAPLPGASVRTAARCLTES